MEQNVIASTEVPGTPVTIQLTGQEPEYGWASMLIPVVVAVMAWRLIARREQSLHGGE